MLWITHLDQKGSVIANGIMNTSEYIQVRQSQLKFYRDVELFNKIEGKGFVLYKRAGITLSEMRLDRGTHPQILYIKRVDRFKGLKEAQKGFNKELKRYIQKENPEKIRTAVIDIVSETLLEPRSGCLEGVSDTVSILVNDYVREENVINNLLNMSHTDYSIVLHSINVMAFALGFAFHMDYSQEKAKELGLCALLHDVGKTKVDQKLLVAPRKLTGQEFEKMKKHTTIGFALLKNCKFASKNISITALEHHEKTDGSGYPDGKTRISYPAKIVGLIDCYEALTTDERPYREATVPFDTLDEIIGNEVRFGKFDRNIYVEFVKSLGNLSPHRPLGIDNDGRQMIHQVGNVS